MKQLSTLSLNPLDGRYQKQLAEVAAIFSEANLIRLRVLVEIRWFEALANSNIKNFSKLNKKSLEFLHNIITKFNQKDIMQIKIIEKKTNHDIKAVEYYIKEKLSRNKQLNHLREFVHFGCTSDDINNLSYALMLKDARAEIITPLVKKLLATLKNMSHDFAEIPMLSRTHGQPATPTTFGKEIANFTYRLHRQLNYFIALPILGKFNGAVGNFNAHIVAYKEIGWQKVCKKFVGGFGLIYNPYTTQIEPHDWVVEYCDTLARFNTILLGFCRDLWGYISLDYLKLKNNPKEIGSSTMPHKINPIDFENAEGNLGIANALFQYFTEKLPISRFQRDLSDSTVMRNLGVAIGYSVLAYKSVQKGLNKLEVNKDAMQKDLEDNWQILAEAIQMVMRKYNISGSYEKTKALVRGKKIDSKSIKEFINKLNLPLKEKQQLLKITPTDYIGKAKELARKI